MQSWYRIREGAWESVSAMSSWTGPVVKLTKFVVV